MERRKPSDIVPSPYGRLFKIYDSFNEVQISVLDDLLNTDKSIVLSAPTGSGKTVAFELAIVRMLIEGEKEHNACNYFIPPKAIYIAPIKALCSEKHDNWKDRFDAVGINCNQLTGDTQSSNLMAIIHEAQVVISTPEKWDSITRRWRDSDFEELLSSIKLFIVDEVHLLNDDSRGPILEAIVARMKSCGVKRFLVASATIPNVDDLTNWLRSCNINVAQYVFNEMQRPVPLEKHVIGINSKLKGFQFDMKLNYQLPNIIQKYSDDKATIVFCNSRKSSEMAAFSLSKQNCTCQLTDQQKRYLCQLSEQIIDIKLRKLIEKGIAYHHAGLQYSDRNLIESSFREGFLMILFCTSTLAMGINLPAHLVVIKSTEAYMHSGYVEYPEHMLLQMIGRAGRPQYDTKGVAVIITQNIKVEKYKNLINGKAPIESHLHKHLTEHLNSEIALNSINNLEAAMKWIRSTYLYVRSVRNPKYYGLPPHLTKDLVEHKLEELTLKQIKALDSAGLIEINHVNGLNVQTTEIGKLMSRYYLSFETMKEFHNLTGNASLKNIFDIIVQCKELSEFTLRVNEKKILNALNKTPIRFPIKGRIKSTEQKLSCVMQAVLGSLEITSPSLVQESLKMLRICERVSKCLIEYVRLCVQKNIYNNAEIVWFKTVLNAFVVAKCFHAKLWENSDYAFKQIRGIGIVYSALLFNAGKTTLKSVAETDARTIEHILNKPAPFGDEVLQNLLLFPEYEIRISRLSENFIEIYARQLNESYIHKANTAVMIIVGDSLNNLLLLVDNFDAITSEYGCFKRKIEIQNKKVVEYIYGHIVHTTIVGVDACATLEINAPKIQTPKQITRVKKQIQLRTKCNETCDSDFLSESTITNKLKDFQFKKPKMSHDKQSKNSTFKTIVDGDINPIKILTKQPLKDRNTLKAKNIVQSKLTDFFIQHKKTDNMTAKKSLADLIKAAGENQSEMSRSRNNEHQCEHLSASNTKQELNHDSTVSSSPIKVTCIENIPARKRNLSPNDISLDSLTKSSTKKLKHENNINSGPSYNKYPMTLASFLGNFGQLKPIPPFIEKETSLISKDSKQEQQGILSKQGNAFKTESIKAKPNSFLSPKPTSAQIWVNKDLGLTQPNFPSMSCKDGNNTTNDRPIDLSKTYSKLQRKAAHVIETNLHKSNIKNNLTDITAAEEDVSLWYKVSMKFQKLPKELRSLQNFRHVYNKVMKKEKAKVFSQSNQFSSTVCSTGNKCDKYMKPILQKPVPSREASFSSANKFRLQLFAEDANTFNKTISPETVNKINRNVMKEVLKSKCEMQTAIESMDIDEQLSNALNDFDNGAGPDFIN